MELDKPEEILISEVVKVDQSTETTDLTGRFKKNLVSLVANERKPARRNMKSFVNVNYNGKIELIENVDVSTTIPELKNKVAELFNLRNEDFELVNFDHMNMTNDKNLGKHEIYPTKQPTVNVLLKRKLNGLQNLELKE